MKFDYQITNLIEVHDGDSFKCMADLGVETFRMLTIRLARINAPELTAPDGPLWQGHLMGWLNDHQPNLRVTTLKYDNWHRWVSEVYDSATDENYSDYAITNGCPPYNK